MNFSDEQFRSLEEELKITEESKTQLRSRILLNVDKRKKRNLKPYRWITAAICMLLIITSPFYSKTMAKIVEKILPISINSSYTNGQGNPDINEQLFELIEKEGYTVNSVGTTLSPYTIDISLILKDSTLKQAKDDLEPKVRNLLYDNGYDEFKLKVSEAPEIPETHSDEEIEEINHLFEKAREIVKNVFTSYGYAEEADYELAGLKSTNILILDMPDHIQESTDIIADIKKKIDEQNLPIKDIEVNTFNLEHRKQDERWGTIATDIYDSMEGKSTYQLTGLSYIVKKGHTYVDIKTDFEKQPSEEIRSYIEVKIQEYLSLQETKEQIQNDKYTIQFLLKNGETFLTIQN